MRYGRITQSLAQVAGICAQDGPYTEQYWERSNNGCSKYDCNDLRRRLRVGAEDVVNLRLGGVTKGRLWDGERSGGIAGNLKVENLALVRRRRTKGADYDRGNDGLVGGEELVGEVLVRL